MSDHATQTMMFARLPGMAYRSLNDPERPLIEVSGKVEALTGFSAARLTGDASGLAGLIQPRDRDRVWRQIQEGLAHDGCFDLEYRIITADGGVKPVQEHGEGVPDGQGGWRELVGFVSDCSMRVAQQERLELAHRAIVRAAEHPLQGAGDIQAYAAVLTRLLSDTLHVQFAGIWLMDPDQSSLAQLCVYDRQTDSFTQGLTLAAADYPDYFAALMSGRAIDAADARQDPRTCEFRESYLEPHGINAMLDAAIRVNGKIVGIVCCEHTGSVRRWYADEISFAGEIADQMAQSLISRDKLEAMRLLNEERGSIRARNDFMARLSHEIRTPMNGVLGMTELLQHTVVTAEQREYLDVIAQSGRLLLHIINDILDYSKIEAGKLALNPQPCNIADLLHNLGRQFQSQANAAGLQLQWRIDDSLPTLLRCDAGRVQQILVNLIGNALKFTRQGSVRIHAWLQESGENTRWCISVTDSGDGIEPELLGRIFEPFEQGEHPAAGGEKGTGLGLAIARSLAQLMQGSLEVVSEPGKGSVFTLRLPLAEVAESVSGGAEPARLKPERVRLPGMNILVVEDDDTNRKVILGMLDRYFGIRADSAVNGLDALEQMASGRCYDLIFMDCEMPLMDGYETTRRIRTLPAPGGQTPVAAISAHALEEMKAKAFAAGVNYYVTKPFGQEELFQVIRQVRDGAGS